MAGETGNSSIEGSLNTRCGGEIEKFQASLKQAVPHYSSLGPYLRSGWRLRWLSIVTNAGRGMCVPRIFGLATCCISLDFTILCAAGSAKTGGTPRCGQRWICPDPDVAGPGHQARPGRASSGEVLRLDPSHDPTHIAKNMTQRQLCVQYAG